MGIRQLSVFVENKKGSLHEITDVLAKAGIDLRSMCIADTSDYGIVRIIANDPIRAKAVLEEAGHTANIRTITAFAVPDQPGGLARVLNLLEEKQVIYMLKKKACVHRYSRWVLTLFEKRQIEVLTGMIYVKIWIKLHGKQLFDVLKRVAN